MGREVIRICRLKCFIPELFFITVGASEAVIVGGAFFVGGIGVSAVLGSILKYPDEWREFVTDQFLAATEATLHGIPVIGLAINLFQYHGILPRIHRDPLVLDLNGDGIKTTNLNGDSVTFFDSNSDGFAEMTGWADAHDGVLAMDRNGNGVIDDGAELFGDQTILKNGNRAANGFQALAELDSNGDGKIDANDPTFSQLRVLTLNANGDGYELRTLDELGIKSINLDSTITNTTDEQGNTQTRIGSFEMVDGTVKQIGEYSFQNMSVNSIATEWLPVPDDIEAMPDLQGYGTVYDLHQAMVRDASGELKSLVEQFANANDANARAGLMYSILLKWTGADQITDSRLRFDNFDNRKIQMLENIFGQPFTIKGESEPNDTENTFTASESGGSGSGVGPGAGPGGAYLLPPSQALMLTDESVINLKESYRLVFEYMYGMLMAQTHLLPLYEKIGIVVDDQKQEIRINMNPVIADLQTSLAANPEQGRELLSEFARSIRGFGGQKSSVYFSFREAFIQMDPSLGWVIDSGGLPVLQGQWGTENAEAMQGVVSDGYGGDDVIYGTDASETLKNGDGFDYMVDGDSLIFGAGGNDTIWAGRGDDILDGGEGDDRLLGEYGNDIYMFRRGSGHDTIEDADPTSGNIDTIWLGSNLTPEDIVLRRVGDNLVLSIIDTTDTLTVKNFFRNDSLMNRVERIQFMDGTVWTDSDMIDRIYIPTEGDDVIYGVTANNDLSGLSGDDRLYGEGGDDTLHGDSGADRLYGGSGSDILDGGTGDDILDGGTGNDTYLFSRGSGQDTIIDQDTSVGNLDTIQLGEGIAPTDIKLERIGNGFKLTISDTGDSVAVTSWLQGDTPRYGVEAIKFADGTTWDVDTIKQQLLQGTAGDDTIVGYSSSDTIQGLDGADTLYGRAGDDTLDGGAGSDTVYGEAGADTLRGSDGDDTLLGGPGNDVLDGGPGDDILTGGSSTDSQVYLNHDNANGNDTYLFGRGSGQDIVVDHDKVTGNTDTILLSEGITPDDITLQRKGDDLELSIIAADDTLTVKNYFWNDSTEYRVERIQFADGTVWSIDDLKSDLNQGTSGDDILIGYSVSDSLNGYEGADKIYAMAA